MNWKNVVSRAAWTFFQGAVGTITVLPYLTDNTGWQNVANAAIAGGIASLVSFLKTVSQEALSPSGEPVPIPRVEVPAPEPEWPGN